MKKKILVLIGLIILTTGCDATINVNIDKENINQKYIISMSGSEISNGTVYKTIEQNLLDKEFDSEVLSYFTINNNINSNPLKASRTYLLDNYTWDTLIARCYDNQNITYENNVLKINASGFNCYDKYSILNNINLNVTTNYKVLNNNANKVDGNTYTWNITKNNVSNINMEIDFNNKEANNKTILIVLGITCSLIVIGYFSYSIFKYKLVKNDSI